ncbi:MAG: ComEC/Rec2 family competence protein [Sulfurospirillum sp.]|nr:ComEC/Rec2 family competence protein [Sulfurospirillum sp.]MBL0703473.1 ComEC/Rec2 family competence protein [Sulfurospirillum sp.]
MQSLPLFITKREIFSTFFLLAVLFSFSLLYQFYKYKQITTYSLHVTTAKVIKHYKKKSETGEIYTVLKLKNRDFIFYTAYWKPLEVDRNDELKVIFDTKKIDFYEYLKGFYASAKSLHVVKKNGENGLVDFVVNQHTDLTSQELYRALFFAIPISKELREDINKWGIAHLVAISGFHLGILSSILFFFFKYIYTFFQDKYFPYRNRMADLAFLVFVVLGCYIYFIDMPPSVVRAFVMSIIGFLLFSRNIKIISFGTLSFTIVIVLIFFPNLLFSIAFWFSVMGVFYIFLFLYHFSNLNKVAIFILLNFWVYVLMLPVVHFVFDVFSFYQLFSPLISMLFILFYPLSLALHVMNLGGSLDSFLIWFFSLHIEVYLITTPLWFFVSYLIVSLLAIRFRYIAFFLPIFSLSLFFI